VERRQKSVIPLHHEEIACNAAANGFFFRRGQVKTPIPSMDYSFVGDAAGQGLEVEITATLTIKSASTSFLHLLHDEPHLAVRKQA
jgi:hypothetical protein